MNDFLSKPLVRAVIVAGLTYAAWKYLPGGAVAKTVTLAVGGVAAAGILGQAVPQFGAVMNGYLPIPAAA